MAQVSGDLQTVTDVASTVRRVEVRAARTHPSGTGLVLDEPVPYPVEDGQVSFPAKPGPAVMVLQRVTGNTKSVNLIIPEGVEEISLADAAGAAYVWEPPVVSAAQQAATRATQAADRSKREADRSKAEADRSASSATSAGRDAKRSEDGATRSETAAGKAEASATSATQDADRSKREADRSKTEADRSAASATSAGRDAKRSEDGATRSEAAQGKAEAARDAALAGADRVGSAERVLQAEESATQSAADAARDAARAETAAEALEDGVPDGAVTRPKLAPDLAAEIDAKADLVGGVVPTSQIPAVALTKPFSVTDRDTMLALDAQEGDVAIITAGADRGSYMLGDGDPALFESWVPLAVPQDTVTSVNGQTGTVVLGPSDVDAAPKSHRHAWEQIDDKPNLATMGDLEAYSDDGCNRRHADDPATNYPRGVSMSMNNGVSYGWNEAIRASTGRGHPDSSFVIVLTMRNGSYSGSTTQLVFSYNNEHRPVFIRKWDHGASAWGSFRSLTDDGHTHTRSQITDLPDIRSSAVPGSLAQRTGSGNLEVPATPAGPTSAASVSYVDDRGPRTEVVNALPSSPTAGTIYYVREA